MFINILILSPFANPAEMSLVPIVRKVSTVDLDGIHANELPVGPALDVVGVVVDLCLVGGLLFFQVGGHSRVGRDQPLPYRS